MKQSKDETNQASMKSKKPRLDRKMNNLLFCLEIDCCDSFEKRECLEAHLLSDQHTKVETVTLVDKAKQSYVEKMKISLSASFNNMEASSSSMALDEFKAESFLRRKRMGITCEENISIY